MTPWLPVCSAIVVRRAARRRLGRLVEAVAHPDGQFADEVDTSSGSGPSSSVRAGPERRCRRSRPPRGWFARRVRESAQGLGASGGGVGSSRPTAKAARNSVSHSLSLMPCQVRSVSRPSGRNARCRLVKAAIGSPKNIEPMREMTTSNASHARRGGSAASAWRNSTLSSPSAAAVLRANASICDDRSTPSAWPFVATRATSRIGLSVAAADVEHTVAFAHGGHGEERGVTVREGLVEALGLGSPERALVAVPCSDLAGVGRIGDQIGLGVHRASEVVGSHHAAAVSQE